MLKRKAISAGELYANLDRDFRVRQPRECTTCYILLPFRVDEADLGRADQVIDAVLWFNGSTVESRVTTWWKNTNVLLGCRVA